VMHLLGRWTATVGVDHAGEPITTSQLALTQDMVEDVLDHATWVHGDQPRAGWLLKLHGGFLACVVLLGARTDGGIDAQVHAAAGSQDELKEWMMNWVIDGATDHAPSVRPFIGSLV